MTTSARGRSSAPAAPAVARYERKLRPRRTRPRLAARYVHTRTVRMPSIHSVWYEAVPVALVHDAGRDVGRAGEHRHAVPAGASTPWPWRAPAPPARCSRARSSGSGRGCARACALSYVPEDLVVVAHGAPREVRTRAWIAATSSASELAQRVLDAQVRQVEVLLVDERGDARVDLQELAARSTGCSRSSPGAGGGTTSRVSSTRSGRSIVLNAIARPVRNSSRVLRLVEARPRRCRRRASTVISGASTYSMSMRSREGLVAGEQVARSRRASGSG